MKKKPAKKQQPPRLVFGVDAPPGGIGGIKSVEDMETWHHKATHAPGALEAARRFGTKPPPSTPAK